MGCHTWFYRPLPADEILKHREFVRKELEEMKIEEEWDLSYRNYHYNRINTMVYDWILEYDYYGEGVIYYKHNGYYVDVDDFHDEFRIKNYPKKILHNYRQTKRWLLKKGKALTEEESNRLKEFWGKYKGGIIRFG